MSCPHCGADARMLERLGDGVILCNACAKIFAPPPPEPPPPKRAA